ncbi:MAG TPA: pyroglutamyl-peptidase I [Bacillota bacterium]|nr:pyroglutamyl-peptidase I [Bacillota bacterium]
MQSNEKLYIDLHCHSTASDGTDSPARLVAHAVKNRVDVLALTDHDTIAGLPEAKLAASQLGITFIPGVEISANYGTGEMHLLGLGIQETVQLQAFLQRMVKNRDERNRKILAKLNQLGFKIDLTEVEAVAKGDIVSRPHMATVMLGKGYVSSRQEAFDLYLANGAKCYVQRDSPSPEECIASILAAGGVPVLAHPIQLGLSRKALIQTLLHLKAAGLQGMEVWHSDQNGSVQHDYYELAQMLDLLPTGGSDYHGSNKPHVAIGRGIDKNISITDHTIVERLLKQASDNQKNILRRFLMKKVLLTGFQPFGGEAVNPAWAAVKELTGKIILDHEIVTGEIPVVRYAALIATERLIEEYHPEIVINVGQAGSALVMRVERIGINCDDYSIPDNAGNQPMGEPVVPEGPAAYFVTLPIKAMVQEMNLANVPAEVSNSAGTYLCNHVCYGVSHIAACKYPQILTGFIHIPFLPEQAAGKRGRPSMAVTTVVTGLEAAVSAAIRYRNGDINAEGGAQH